MKLMLDECISPALVRPLWDMNVDTTCTRDRAMLEATDQEVWRYAQREDRSVVTINAGHFERLARKTPRHAGLVIIPSGTSRDGQLKMITSVIESALVENVVLPSLRGRIYWVNENGAFSMESELAGDPATVSVLRVVRNS
jgi:predicted nuclease of predicted toxin-antitoxin system